MFNRGSLLATGLDPPELGGARRWYQQAAEAGSSSPTLDRLSRSLVDFAGPAARAQVGGWSVVALDLGIDLATPAGEFMANVVASAAQWERRIIGQRTRNAPAIKAAQRVRFGRPTTLDPSIVERIVIEHAAGAGWSAIARSLNTDGGCHGVRDTAGT